VKKLIVAFSNFANAPKKSLKPHTWGKVALKIFIDYLVELKWQLFFNSVKYIVVWKLKNFWNALLVDWHFKATVWLYRPPVAEL